MNQRQKAHLVVYTVLVGDKEMLNDPLRVIGHDAETDLRIDYVCFTDNDALTSPTWQMRRLEHPLMPPERLSRLPKTQPHLFFPDYEHSLYIDNTVVFKRLPRRSDLRKSVFRAFRHPWRHNPVDEADIIVKNGLDISAPVADQLRFYNRRGAFDGVETLTTGTALLRKHKSPQVKKFGELWWEQILLFSKRDQISLDVCAKAAGCPIDHFDGDKLANDFIFWPALATEKRVLGSFDDERYAWEHRQDPDAVAHPRQHYLLQAPEGNNYTRHTNWFEYLCNRLDSGLGTTAPPRRCIASVIDPLLTPAEGSPSRILLVGVKSSSPYAADAEELVQAQKALTAYFRFSAQPTIVPIELAEEVMHDVAPFRGAGGLDGFQLVIVLGLSAHFHSQALSKFDLLLAANGKLLIQFGGSLTSSEIDAMLRGAHSAGSSGIFHGTHITNPNPMASSVVLYSPSPSSQPDQAPRG